jgi:hypothetical protein
LILLCGGWFPGACGDRQLIRPSVGRVAASRARLARLTAEWFLRVCDGRLQIRPADRLGIFSGQVTIRWVKARAVWLARAEMYSQA